MLGQQSTVAFTYPPLVLIGGLTQAAEPISIDTRRDANCGCCKTLISHLQDHGFSATDPGHPPDH